MELTHYANELVIFDPERVYAQIEPKGHLKPVGLWVSVDGEDDWPAWCLGEEFGGTPEEDYYCLRHAYRVSLRAGANVHLIDSDDSLLDFHGAFCHQTEHTRMMEAHYPIADYGLSDDFAYRQLPIDWAAVTREFDGLIIAPFLWNLRLFGPMWYYGWDCASGCIWNTAAIESFDPIESLTPERGAT